ncbi:MAG: hypothetical protein KIS92_20105 [Planctomycetota bacterium]|nr:hypothetical protein [Planctomycetota bacterium]
MQSATQKPVVTEHQACALRRLGWPDHEIERLGAGDAARILGGRTAPSTQYFSLEQFLAQGMEPARTLAAVSGDHADDATRRKTPLVRILQGDIPEHLDPTGRVMVLSILAKSQESCSAESVRRLLSPEERAWLRELSAAEQALYDKQRYIPRVGKRGGARPGAGRPRKVGERTASGKLKATPEQQRRYLAKYYAKNRERVRESQRARYYAKRSAMGAA